MTSVRNLTSLSYQQYAAQFPVIYTYSDIIIYVFRAMGTCTAAVNAFVFANRTILDSSDTFYYLLIIAVADFLYLGPLLISNVLNKACSASSTQCSSGVQYLALFMSISIQDYLSSSLAVFNIVMEIFLTIQRLYIFNNKVFPHPRFQVRHVFAIISIFSLLFYVPICFQTVIQTQYVELKNGTMVIEYSLVKTTFGKSVIGKLTPVILSTIRLILCGPILLAASIANIVYFQRYLDKKMSVSGTTVSGKKSAKMSSNNRMSIVIIITAFLYTFGNLPYMIYYSLSQAIPWFNSSAFMFFMNWFSRVCLSSLIIFKLPVYYVFNRLFKTRFLSLFCCMRPELMNRGGTTMHGRSVMSPSNRPLRD